MFSKQLNGKFQTRQILLVGLVLGIGGMVFGEATVDKALLGQEPGCETVEETDKADVFELDQALRRTFEQKLTALKEAGKTEKPETLIEQLGRKRCSSILPKAGMINKTAAEIYRDHKQSVMVLGYLFLCDNCDELHLGCATGFVVAADGVVATNYHVVEGDGLQALGIMTADGSVYGVQEVLAADKARDVALVRVDAEKLKAAALSTDEPVGAGITVISHPDSHFYSLTRGVISRYTKRQRHRRSVQQMEITADYARGSSGGPVFNDRGSVVGMVRSTDSIYYSRENGTDQNLQMVIKSCIPAEAILNLFKNND